MPATSKRRRVEPTASANPDPALGTTGAESEARPTATATPTPTPTPAAQPVLQEAADAPAAPPAASADAADAAVAAGKKAKPGKKPGRLCGTPGCSQKDFHVGACDPELALAVSLEHADKTHRLSRKRAAAKPPPEDGAGASSPSAPRHAAKATKASKGAAAAAGQGHGPRLEVEVCGRFGEGRGFAPPAGVEASFPARVSKVVATRFQNARSESFNVRLTTRQVRHPRSPAAHRASGSN